MAVTSASLIVALVSCAVVVIEIVRRTKAHRGDDRRDDGVRAEETTLRSLDRTVLHGDAVAWLEDPKTSFPPKCSVFTSIPFDGECQGPSGKRFARWGECSTYGVSSSSLRSDLNKKYKPE